MIQFSNELTPKPLFTMRSLKVDNTTIVLTVTALVAILCLASPSGVAAQEASCVADSLTGADATLQFLNPLVVEGSPDRFTVDLALESARTFDLGGLTFVYSYNDDALDFETINYAAFTAANPCYSTIGANSDNGRTAVGLYVDPRIDGCSASDGGSGTSVDPADGTIVVATVSYTIQDASQTGDLKFLASETHSDENQICITDDGGDASPSLVVGVEDVYAGADLPDGYRIGQAYPNPFNPMTQLSLEVSVAQKVVVDVFDMMGRQVAELFSGEVSSATPRNVTWQADEASSGVYIIRVIGERFHEVRQVTLLK